MVEIIFGIAILLMGAGQFYASKKFSDVLTMHRKRIERIEEELRDEDI